MIKSTVLHSNWEFIQSEREGKKSGISMVPWLPATVPGHVHADLVENGVIADPFLRMNELGCQWVDEVGWTYRTSFKWTPDASLPNRALRFEGLDTVCKVWLNGQLIAEHDNMFVPIEVDVSDALLEGENQLRIEFESAIKVGKARRAEYFEKEGLAEGTANFDERSFVRKAQYMYGWDWGPRLVSCGVWRPVRLIEFSSRIVDLQVHQEFQEDGSIHLRVDLEVQGPAKYLAAALIDPFGEVIAPEESGLLFNVTDPALWDPTENEPSLYHLMVTLADDSKATLEDAIALPSADSESWISGHLEDNRELNIGLGSVRMIQEPDKMGTSFEFEVNGSPLWIRGANWIPDHSFPGIISRQRTREQIQRAKELGCNMLRVWGGGIYESDDFYELCDELGMLVWQDFPFACAYYPDDEAAQAVIKKEAAANIQRLRNHPSLALWCGNNENLTMFQGKWGGADNNPPRYYGEHLYNLALPQTVQELDPERDYIATSPIGPGDDANAGGSGDSHYWDVWHGRGDWRFYADSTARFSSEFGFCAAPSLSVMSATLEEEDWEIRSPAVQWHNKTGKPFEQFFDMVCLHYPTPKSLEDWVYYSQLNQRDALRFGIEHYRRSWFCRGTLIWQLNDCWPVQSWAVLDSEANFKAAAYELRRLHEDVMLSIERDNEKLSVWVANDSYYGFEDLVTLTAYHLQTGEVLRTWSDAVEVSANERKIVVRADLSGLPVPDTIVVATATELTSTWQLVAEPKNARLPEPSPIIISVAEDGVLRIKTTSPVVDLMITSEGSTLPFLDNVLTAPVAGIYSLRCAEPPAIMEARSLSGEHRIQITRSPFK